MVADQIADLPPRVAAPIGHLVEEYEARDSLEARVTKEADKLECLRQAREYEAQGSQGAAAWVPPSVASIRTSSGCRLAASCETVPPRQWWKNFVDPYIRPAPPTNAPRDDEGGPAALAR